MKTPVIGRIALFVLLLRSAPAAAADDPLRLTIGDPSRRDKTAPLVLDGITETATGALLKPSDLPSRLSAVRILFVGEEHVSVESHAVELAVLRELSRAGRRVSVGLEMFPVDAGPALADWTAGRLTEAEFLEKSGWMKHWSYNWDYYRAIFVFARDNRIPLFGVNVPPELVSTVGRKGLDALEPAQRALLPERVDWDNAESKRLFQASFDEDEFHGALPEAMLNRMVQAQATWDAAFGWNAVLGAERQARLWFSGKTATLVPVAISDAEKGRCAIESVQASLADYVWGIPEEEDPRYPTPGFATRRVENDGQPEVIQVDKKSSAARAGLKVGDRLLEVDGRPTADREAIRNAFADKRWGDGLRLTVRRGDEKMPLDVVLRRERPSPCKPKV